MLTEGEWQHPVYSKLKFTKQRLQRFVDNFNSRAYGQDLPLDVNHMPSDQGAPGWITEMRLAEVSGKWHLQVKPELNSYGDLLVSDNRVRYVSASFRDYWTSPEGQKVRDLMVAVALTERPYFKHLGGINKHVEQATGDDPQVMLLIEEAGTMGANADQGKQGTDQATPPPANGDNQVSLAELQQRLATVEAQNKTLAEQNQQATAGLLQAQHDRQLSELKGMLAVTNFGSEANSYKLAETHCKFWAEKAMRFSDAAPVDAEGKPVMLAENKPAPSEREEFLTGLRTLASGLVPQGVKGFASADQPGGGDQTTAMQQLNDKVSEKQAAAKAAGQELDYVTALTEVAKENPGLVEAARG